MGRSNGFVPVQAWPAGPSWSILGVLERLFSAQAGGPSVRASVAVPVASRPLLDELRVLVVDDDPVNLMVAAEMLSSLGIEPLLAENGAQAVALAGDLPLNLILMDLQMPVLDGLGATRQIRRVEAAHSRLRVPVVAYTTHSLVEPLLREHGFDGTLEKPCAMQALQDCLLRWCPLHSRAM